MRGPNKETGGSFLVSHAVGFIRLCKSAHGLYRYSTDIITGCQFFNCVLPEFVSTVMAFFSLRFLPVIILSPCITVLSKFP